MIIFCWISQATLSLPTAQRWPLTEMQREREKKRERERKKRERERERGGGEIDRVRMVFKRNQRNGF